MEYIKSLYGYSSGGPLVEDFAVYGNGAAMLKGAAVMRGTTLGTNLNYAILASGALTDIIGVLHEAHALVAAGTDTNVDGTSYGQRKIITDPFAIYRARFDTADTMAVASVGTTTTVTVTSGETNMGGGWLYCVSGTGIGRLSLITTDDGSGEYTTAAAHGLAVNDTLIKIVPKWHQLIKISTDATMIGTDAAAGSGRVVIRDLWIQSNSIQLTRLNPLNHSGLTGLNTDNVRFYADIMFSNHVFNLTD